MKLSNLFKKSTKQSANNQFQPLTKNQLAKVIGGGDGDATTTATTEATKTRAKVIMDRDSG